MSDPLANIEEKHGQQSIGAVALNIYEGAISESGSRRNAFWATVAAILAILKAQEEPTA